MTILAALRIAIESGDVTRATAELDKMTAAGARAEKGAKGVEGATAGLGQAMGYLKAAIGGAVAAFGVTEFLRLRDAFLRTADSVTSLNTQLTLATGSASKASAAYDQLLAVANRSRVSFTELGSTFSSISRATQDLGISTEKTMRLTETLGKAITISGGSSQSANAAMIQLSQGLSSGTLRGEELNSIMEQTPRIARALADGLGVGIGQLRKMGQEGKLTGDVVTEALLKSADSIDKEFGRTATTVAQASTVLQNSVTDLIGKLDKLTGESSRTAKGIISLANGLSTIAGLVDRLNSQPLPQILLGGGPAEGSGNLLENASPVARIAAALSKRLLRTSTEINAENAARDKSASESMSEIQANYLKEAQDAEKAAAASLEAARKFSDATHNMTPAQAKQAALSKRLTEFAESVKGFSTDSEVYLRNYKALQTGIANIDKDFKNKINPKAEKDPNAEAYATEIRNSTERLGLLKAEAEARRPLLESERMSMKFKADEIELAAKHGTARMAEVRALHAQEVAEARKIEKQKEEKATIDALFASAIALQEARDKNVETLLTEAEAADAQVKAMQQETEAIGVTGVALALLTNKRTDDIIEALKRKREDADSTQAVDAINRQIAALERLKTARVANAEAHVLHDAQATAEDEAKKASEAWKQTYQNIGQGLTDSLFRAAESGKGFFMGLRDSIKGMFANLVLKPLIQFGATTALGAAGQAMGLGGAGTGALGNLASLLSTGQALSNGTGVAGAISGYLAGQASTAAGVQGASALAIGAAPAELAGVGATTGSSIMSAIGAIPGWGWAAMAAVAIAAVVSADRGGPKGGGSFSTSGERLFTPNTADEMAVKIGDGLSKSITGMVKDFGGASAGLQYGIGFDQDPMGKADNRVASFLRSASGKLVMDNIGGRNVGRDDAQLQTELTTEAKRLMLAALQASDLEHGFGEIFARLDPAKAAPGAIDELFALAQSLRSLGEASKDMPGIMGSVAELSATAREQLIGFAGGLDQLVQRQNTYYNEFFNDQEKLAASSAALTARFSEIGLSFEALQSNVDGPRQAFRSLVEGLDLTTESGRQSYTALLALAGPLDGYLDALDAQTQAAEEVQTATESAAAVVADFSAEVDRLNASISSTESEMNSIGGALDQISPGAESVADRLLRMSSELSSLESALDGIVGNGGKSPIEQLQGMIAARDSLTSARGGIAAAIQDQRLQGFLTRGDNAGAVAFLQAIEGSLWQSLAAATDKGAVANQIKDTFLTRIGIQARAGQSEVDQANQAAYDAAKELADLDKQHRAEQVAGLRELISNTARFRDLAQGLRDSISGIKTSDVSSLNAQQKLDEAVSRFDSVITRAFAGDTGAIGQAAGAAQAALGQGRAFYGSTSASADLFNEVTARLDALQAALDSGAIQSAPKPELTAAEKQLEALLSIEDPIIALKQTTVDFSQDAIDGLSAIDTALGAGVDFMQAAIVAATDAVALQIAGMRTELRTNAQNAQDRWISLGIDLTNLSDRLEDIEAAVNGTTNAVITAADTVPTAG